MLGLGPPAEPLLVTAAAGVTVRADAAWLTKMSSAAVAKAAAAKAMRSLPCAAWMIFIGWAPFAAMRGAGACPLRLCAASPGPRYRQPDCTWRVQSTCGYPPACPRASMTRNNHRPPGSEGNHRDGYPAQHRPRPRRLGRRLMLEQRHRA